MKFLPVCVLVPVLLCLPGLLRAQTYNYIPFTTAKSNPGSLNTEDDVASPQRGQGWTVLYSASTDIPEWSVPMTLPFDFVFNKKTYRSFSVSNSGVLTFSVPAGAAPAYSNARLPDPSLPDNSICIRGLEGRKNYASIVLDAGARTPSIRMKTFGSAAAANRQVWISFVSFSAPGVDSTRALLTNWSIVLEETTHYVYIVDQGTFSYVLAPGGFKPEIYSTQLTVGMQFDATDVLMVAGSPNVSSQVLNPKVGITLSFTPHDNGYYCFVPITSPPRYDAGLARINAGEYLNGSPAGVSITGDVLNYGPTITSITISYAVDGGPAVDTTLHGVFAPFGYTIPYTTALWRPSSSGSYSVRVWCSGINGNQADVNRFNDTASVTTYYLMNPPARRPLLEEFTGTWCGHCPRGLSAFDTTLRYVPEAIGIAYHVTSDPMANTFSNAFADLFTAGYPSGMVDRTTFSKQGEFRPILTIPMTYLKGDPYIAKARLQLLEPTPVEVSIDRQFDAASRVLQATVHARFEGAAAGDLRIGAVLVEDSVGGGRAYDQENFMAGNPGFPYWGAQPATLPGFIHRHVARANLAGDTDLQGTPAVIPPVVAAGTSYQKTYSYTIPPEWNVARMNIVAMVNLYDADPTRTRILNTNSVPVIAGPTSVEDPVHIFPSGISVFPSPVRDHASISCLLVDGKHVRLEVYTLLGEKVCSADFGRMPGGKHSLRLDTQTLRSGLYILRIHVGNTVWSERLAVLH